MFAARQPNRGTAGNKTDYALPGSIHHGGVQPLARLPDLGSRVAHMLHGSLFGVMFCA